MQIISRMVLYNYKVPVTIKKNNFSFCPGQSRDNLPNIFKDFPGLMNKIQGLSRTQKKNRTFKDVATLLVPHKMSKAAAIAQLAERQANDRNVAESWFESRSFNVSLRLWERHFMLTSQ